MRTKGLTFKGIGGFGAFKGIRVLKGVEALGFALALGAVVVARGAEPELAGTISVAPFADVSAKATAFGALIGNPIVPALMLASVQQSAVTTYGRFRTDAPIHAASYEVAPGRTEEAIVYPSVDRIARMALANPGSERAGTDVLHLVPSEQHPQERYAVFSADGQFASFAPTAALARRALADCRRPAAGGAQPLMRVDLRPAGLKAVSSAAATAGVTNVLNLVTGISRLELSADLNAQGLVVAFRATSAAGSVKAEGLKARVARELRKMVAGLVADEAKVVPTVRVGLESAMVVTGEIALSQEQLKALGQDFNAFVAAQMSGELSDGKQKKGRASKAATKGKEQKK